MHRVQVVTLKGTHTRILQNIGICLSTLSTYAIVSLYLYFIVHKKHTDLLSDCSPYILFTKVQHHTCPYRG
jgi:hypothetical protein